MRLFVPVLSVLLLGCSGDFWRGCTSAVVGKTVETTKEVSTGVIEGVKEGRKSGESADGALLASNFEELGEAGEVSVFEIKAAGEGASEVVIALSNKTDKPIRFIQLEVSALDSDGFVLKPARFSTKEVTVPPQAKDRLVVPFDAPPAKLGELRLWDTKLEMPK